MRVWKIKLGADKKIKILMRSHYRYRIKIAICSGRVPLKWVRVGEIDGVVRLDYRVGVRTACELVL